MPPAPFYFMPTVCRRWRSAVDDIVGDCRRELTDQKTRGGEVSTPATSLELVVKTQDQPKMTELQAPTAETDTDLRLVGEYRVKRATHELVRFVPL